MHPEKTQARVSVVMATYNGAQYLEEQIESILHQSFPPAELIIVDDCSTDQTLQVLQQCAEKNPIIKVYANTENIGFLKNFERAISYATGDLIALSDQDDIWVLNKLEKLVNGIGGALLIYSDSELVDAAGNSLHKKMSEIKNQLGFTSSLMFVIGTWAPGHTFLFTKELAQKCMPFPKLVAHDFWIAFMATCYQPVKYIAEPLVLYRQHATNTVSANTFAKSNQKKTPSVEERKSISRARIQFLYESCNAERAEEKQAYRLIAESYQDDSLKNRFLRLHLFLKYRNLILAYKRKSALMKILFSIKMFFKIDY